MSNMNRKDETISLALDQIKNRAEKALKTILNGTETDLRYAYNEGYRESDTHWQSLKDDFENQVKKAWKEGFEAGEEKAVIEKEMEYNRGLSEGSTIRSKELDKLYKARDDAYTRGYEDGFADGNGSKEINLELIKEREYDRGYEAGKKDSNTDDHCSVCEFMSLNEWDEPCKDCMYSHSSKFKPKSEKKPITNRQKFAEVFGINDPPNAAAKAVTLNTDGIKVEYENWWEKPYQEIVNGKD